MKYEDTMSRCPACGGPVRSTSNFCPHCGRQIPKETAAVCRRCGARLEPGAKFCACCAEPASSARRPGMGPAWGAAYGESAFSAANFTWWPKSDRMEELCGSVACLVLTAALTVQLVCQVLFQFTFSNLIGNIPMILICIGCWMCFVGGQQNTLMPSGFRLISGSLTFLGIAACVGFGLGCLLGVALIAAAEEVRVIGFLVLLICGGCIYFVWKYWSQLRQAAKAGVMTVQNGSGRIPTSMYSIVLLYISAASKLISLVNLRSAQDTVYKLYDFIYSLDLPYELETAVYMLLNQIGVQTTSFTAILSGLAAVIVPLVAGLILQRLRREQKTWVS